MFLNQMLQVVIDFNWAHHVFAVEANVLAQVEIQAAEINKNVTIISPSIPDFIV